MSYTGRAPLRLLWLLLVLLIGASGCASQGAHRGDAVAVERLDVESSAGTGVVGTSPDPSTARPPDWRGRETQTVPDEQTPGGGQILFDDPSSVPVLFSRDPDLMRAEVASECLSAASLKPRDSLGSLVASLYLSVIDPGEATEALIQGDCAPLDQIVREMTAKGGTEVAPAVVARARALSPPSARRMIETAAAEGLARHAAARGLDVGPTRGTRSAAMAYHPSGGHGVRVERSTGQDEQLYRQAVPGYGIYTFVLVGGGLERIAEADRARHRELFRLIETYSGVGSRETSDPSPSAHVFLIPVDAELGEVTLFNQIAADLSDRMRQAVINELHLRGQQTLAGRLQRAPGPFLIAGLQPRLMPRGMDTPVLVVDLSTIGLEHLYNVVDAFDRTVQTEAGHGPDSLASIHERLQGILPDPSADPGVADATPPSAWVFMLGEPVDGRATVSDPATRDRLTQAATGIKPLFESLTDRQWGA